MPRNVSPQEVALWRARHVATSLSNDGWRPADFWLPDKDVAFLHFLAKDPLEMLNKYAGNPLEGFSRIVSLVTLQSCLCFPPARNSFSDHSDHAEAEQCSDARSQVKHSTSSPSQESSLPLSIIGDLA